MTAVPAHTQNVIKTINRLARNTLGPAFDGFAFAVPRRDRPNLGDDEVQIGFRQVNARTAEALADVLEREAQRQELDRDVVVTAAGQAQDQQALTL